MQGQELNLVLAGFQASRGRPDLAEGEAWGERPGTSTADPLLPQHNSHFSLTANSGQREASSSKSLTSFRLETSYCHFWEPFVHGKASSARPWSKSSSPQTRPADLCSCSTALRYTFPGQSALRGYQHPSAQPQTAQDLLLELWKGQVPHPKSLLRARKGSCLPAGASQYMSACSCVA